MSYIPASALSGLGGGAPTTATYITQTAAASLPNSQALAALSTGLVKVTTTTGALTTATAGTDYATAASVLTHPQILARGLGA